MHKSKDLWGPLAVAQTVKKKKKKKNPLVMRETWVRSLGWEDTLEEAWQPSLIFLPGESPWTEEPNGLQSIRSQSRTRLSD